MTQPGSAVSHTVSDQEAGERFDRLLARSCPELSRSRIQALIRDGHATADGKTITNPSYRVKPSQTLRATVPPARSATVRAQAIPLVIAFEDDDLLVVDKPAGLAVHPAPGTPDSTLVNALLAHCGDSLSGIGGERRPGIVHRLDKDTSGLIVVAKNDVAHVALAAQFQARIANGVREGERREGAGLPRPREPARMPAGDRADAPDPRPHGASRPPLDRRPDVRRQYESTEEAAIRTTGRGGAAVSAPGTARAAARIQASEDAGCVTV